MEMMMDAETTRKVELINKKIDEINQRRYGLHTTKIEDDLDRQELDDYISTLNLTSEQREILERFNRSNQRTMRDQSAFFYGMMIVSVFIEIYLGYAIAGILKQGSTDVINSIYLYLMIAVFVVNGYYVLKFLRFLR